MAVNLINSNDIEITQNGDNIELELINQIPTIDSTVSTTSTNGIENQAITNYVKDINVYSTTEVETGKTWKDGKTIYRRIVEVNTTTTVNSAANLFQANYIDSLTHCEYTIYAGALYYFGPIPVSLYYKPSTHYFQESHTDGWWNSQPMTIIIEYTKVS